MLYDKNVMMPAENYLTRSSWGLLLKPSLLANSNIPISHRCLGTYCSISILQEIDLLLLGVESTNLGWPIWPLRCERPNFGGYQHTWCTRIFPNSTRPIEGLQKQRNGPWYIAIRMTFTASHYWFFLNLLANGNHESFLTYSLFLLIELISFEEFVSLSPNLWFNWVR